MRGRRTPLVKVLVAVPAAMMTIACDGGPTSHEQPSPAVTLAADEGLDGDPPELTAQLEVELGTAVAVFGRGCRPRTVLQRCSPDGMQTYTLASRLREATVVAVWMQLDTGRGRWAVHARVGQDDARAVAAVREQAAERVGLTVVLAARTGDVLVIPSPVIQGLTITARNLPRPAAEALVNAFVTAATGR